MDPVSALGVASAILTFIDFSTKVFRSAKKIHDAQSDVLEENATSEYVVNRMQHFSKAVSEELSILDSSNSTLTGNDAQLRELAFKCKKIADELVQLLEGLRITDSKSWTQAVRVAWKNETNRSKKDRLDKELEFCRSQFQVELDYYTRKETITRLSALLERSKDNNIQMQKLQECVIRFQETLKSSVWNETAKTQIEELLRLPMETLAAIAQERILGGIRFSGIEQRFNDIRPAHFETFNWLFSDKKSTSEELLQAGHSAHYDYKYDDEQKARERNRQLFAQWLSSGSGVFHFSAKLGAGKSTLMKEACNHDAVKAKLREWAGTRELLLGQFFFWRAGTPYQKTLNGMFRGLLYDVLRSKPELIPRILPSHWTDAISTPWQANKIIEITNEAIKDSLERLVSETANSGSLRLFLFIDGLDEMEENTTHTYQDLVATISKWVIESSGNVKVCASSREYLVFLNGFPESQRLHLHRLTRLDMQCYIRDRLKGIANASDIDTLSNNIVKKAQGIFFWVALVTKNIRQQHGDGASMDELLDQINALPDGLYELFRHVLISLETPVRKVAYETFAMMQEARSWRFPFMAIAYAFFRDWKKSQQPDFAATHVIAESNTTALMLERSRMDVRRRFDIEQIEEMQDWGPERVVEACGFENKDRILSLIRGQTRQTGRLLEETPPSNLEPEEIPPELLEEESPTNVSLSDAAGTWGWLIPLVIGMMLGKSH
ncbi:hypothetical protein CkaCkLH20_00557 [Colletotrichum karsti]|uniref:Nephrocystin 3-like N-terminal domain-containing protein n=1 Tax=Colletotrichum karsti TaxID=1095194 RepID=A0A9P6IG59_9PEZI|nr:uncharacterized protein CkaCkLH20_00557 [Colletotrichum karsti]KAF9881411.1 hypothetical protein CkaCkLH20_00557 [Colletotrichum karsti]